MHIRFRVISAGLMRACVTEPSRSGCHETAAIERGPTLRTTCRLVLDSNTERQAAHRFYHLHGLTIRSFHFAKDLTEGQPAPAERQAAADVAGGAVGGGLLIIDGKLCGIRSKRQALDTS